MEILSFRIPFPVFAFKVAANLVQKRLLIATPPAWDWLSVYGHRSASLRPGSALSPCRAVFFVDGNRPYNPFNS